jgi:hypothetical protein
MAFMLPFIANRNSWPYVRDVEYFQDWPVRQPSLLFAGISLEKPEYLTLWRRLNPDPTVEEIIRNYPIRQPLLWVARGARFGYLDHADSLRRGLDRRDQCRHLLPQRHQSPSRRALDFCQPRKRMGRCLPVA